jgi:hypothetical protein
MRKIALTFAILLSAFTVASAASAATKHRRAAQTNSPVYNAVALALTLTPQELQTLDAAHPPGGQ